MLINIGPFRVAIGLQWALTDSKADAKAQLKTRAKGFIVDLKNDADQHWIGYSTDKANDAYAGAALFGLVEANAVICQTIDDTHAWVCVIMDGRPIVEMDSLIPLESARSTAIRWKQEVSDRLQVFGDIPGAKSSTEELIARIEQGIADKSIKKSQLKEIVLRRQGVNPKAIAGIGVLGLLGVVGVLGFNQFKDSVNRALAQEKAAQAQANAKLTAEQLEAKKREDTAKFLLEVKTKRDDMAAKSVPGSVIPLWSQIAAVRGKLPVSTAGGYTPVKMGCVAEACTVSWQGVGKFTRPSDKAKITGQVDTEPTLVASTVYPLQAVVNQQSGQAVQWPSPAALRLGVIETLLLTPGVVVSEPSPIVLNPPPDLGLTPTPIGYMGTIKVSLTGPTAMVSAQGVMDALQKLPAALKSVEFVGFNKQPTVVIEATYQTAAQQQ